MNPEASNLLDQLRDIHAAPDAPWWPPAPGWWVVAALLLMALIILARHLMRGLRERRRRQGWLQHLEQSVATINPQEQPQDYLSTVNRVFKAVAIRAFPTEHCAGLEGEAWTDFLSAKLEQPVPELAVLADGPYQPRPAFDAEAVTDAARQWIRKYG